MHAPKAAGDSMRALKIVVIAMGLAMIGAVIFVVAVIAEKQSKAKVSETAPSISCDQAAWEVPVKGNIKQIIHGKTEWLLEVEQGKTSHIFFIGPCMTKPLGHIVVTRE